MAGFAIASLVIAGVGMMNSATAKADAAKQNAEVAANNAAIEKIRANLNVQEIRRQDRYQQGAQKAAYAGSGVTFSGSPMDELADQAINDHFKQEVAYFNGIVNVGADEASSGLSNFLAGQYKTAGELQVAGLAADYFTNKYASPSASDIPPDQITPTTIPDSTLQPVADPPPPSGDG